jgi:hypothetical protein
MIGDAIALFLDNLPAFLLAAALIIAATTKTPAAAAERYLAWLLLLVVGGSGLWSGFFHVLLPDTAAALIGWRDSPFQLEVGMADLAIGAAACLSFWQDLGFKAAVVMINSIFFLGDAYGHVKQMMVAGNFAPGNTGTPFFIDVFIPVVTIALLLAARRAEAAEALRTQ